MPDNPVAPRPPGPGPPADGDGATAPMETRPQPDTPVCSPPSHPPAVEDDFQFLLCEGCRQESPNLKLLTCLHTLCLGCLSENKPVGQCPVCCTAIPQANGIPDMDNLLFTNLQARLRVYKQITSPGGPNCSRCRGEAALVWCCECEEFFCAKCFEDHQWWHKKKSHKVKKVEELRAESAHQFLEDTRKSCNLFCTSSSHPDQSRVCSIYCQQCEKALCCSCALLDNQHSQFSDICSETQRRQEELSSMERELRRRRSGFEATYASLQGEAARLEEAQREMRELIRQRVEQLVRLIRQEEEELLGLVEARQEQGRRELARELRHVEGVLRRMEAGERLVEKMSLYATEQEVMDMQPFIKGSLQELQRLKLPEAMDRGQPGDLSECRARLQALVERVTGHPDTESQPVPVVEVALENNLQEDQVWPKNQSTLPTSPANLKDVHVDKVCPVPSWHKRMFHCKERGSQISPKILKLECDDVPGPSDPNSNQRDFRREPGTSMPGRNCSSSTDDAEITSIVIGSSDDSEEDTVAFSEAKDSKKPSSPTWSRSGTSPHNSTGPTSPLDDRLEPGALVFFSLKVDLRTQNIMEMAAVNGDHSFRTLIQTPESVLALLPEGVPLEVGVQYLLWHLSLLPRPILIIWNFWGLELPALFKALDATGRKVDFCHVVCGYMDMLSLVKDRVPQAPSYRLNNLLKRYLQQRLGEGALAKAKALQNLWGALALPVSLDMEMMLTHRNAQSYTLLWPFVQEKLLTKRAAKVLAQRNLILQDLEEE
ncbi:protein PML isoform X1 [Pseudopipra pipra]|uniref:protein PML isoform X1 n=1 Tax=Pseudopipra pipra TaxID=415032 RepID=UPI003139FA71